jgi:hypothetical protein
MLTDFLDANFNTTVLWVDKAQNDAHTEVVDIVCRLDASNKARNNSMMRAMRLYDQTQHSNLYAAFGGGFGVRQHDIMAESATSRMMWNVCKSCCDTVAAKISKNKVKATVVTDGADFSAQQKAKKLDKAVYGIMHSSNFHAISKTAFMDALRCGTGVIQTIAEYRKVSYERVFPFEVLVDEMDSMYNKPTKMYRYRLISKRKLIERFGEHDAIKNASNVTAIQGFDIEPTVCLFEAWMLPTDDRPGRYVMCTTGGTLVDEDYVYHDFPFSFIRWSKPAIGFWGTGLVDEVAPSQIEINKILFFIQQAIQLGHAPKWLVKQGSVPQAYLNNKIGSIIPVTGEMPQYYAPLPINQQVIEYLQLIKQEAYSIAGISQLSARAEKPAGINSGVAMQTYNDIESERFVLAGQEFEEFHVDAFKKTIDAAKTVAAGFKGFEILSSGNTGTEIIKWSQVNLERDKYSVKPYPTATLPSHPEARYQRLSEMLQSGMLTPEEFAELSDMPDFQAHNQLKFAPYFACKANIERIIEGNNYIRPEKYDNINLCLTMANNYYLKLRSSQAKEEILDELRLYIDELMVLNEAAQPPEQPAQLTEPKPQLTLPPM